MLLVNVMDVGGIVDIVARNSQVGFLVKLQKKIRNKNLLGAAGSEKLKSWGTEYLARDGCLLEKWKLKY